MAAQEIKAGGSKRESVREAMDTFLSCSHVSTTYNCVAGGGTSHFPRVLMCRILFGNFVVFLNLGLMG